MGNVCCQADINESPLERDIPKLEQYEESKLPEDDPLVESWLQANQNKYSSKVKPMKHKYEERYYYGVWNNGVPEDKGFIYEPNKIFYDGAFVNGLPEGRANIKFLDRACEYDGQLKAGKAEGQGTIDDAKQKFSFTGEWEKSRPKKGKFTLTGDANVASVEFEDFSIGEGTIFYKDSRKYQGKINTKTLAPHGYGKVTFPYTSSKTSYEGEWYQGQMQGKGKFLWTDGSSYDGEYLEGKKQGWGKFTFPSSGNYYVGYWFDGKQDGVGILYDKNGGEVRRGVWRAGLFKQSLSEQLWKEQSKIQQKKISEYRSKIEQSLKRQEPSSEGAEKEKKKEQRKSEGGRHQKLFDTKSKQEQA